MKGPTHAAAGILTGVLVCKALQVPEAETLLVSLGSGAAAFIPDIDTYTSTLGRKIAPASFLIKLFIGHRTIFHAPLPYILLAALMHSTGSISPYLILSFLIGVLSHIVLDSLNPMGVPLLWPIHTKFHFATFRTGGMFDWILCLFMTLAIVAFSFSY